MPLHLHLCLPDLLWPEPEELALVCREANPAPALTTLLQRTPPVADSSRSAEEHLAALAGYPGAPLAPLRLLGEAVEPPAPGDWWLCSDPIHLRLMREQMLAAAGNTLQLTTEEAQALVALLNTTFADIGQFIATSPDRWYLRLPQPCPFPAPPLSRIAGRRLHDELPQGGDATPLLQFLVEAQMLLHSAPSNRQRSGNAANSLWLWGAGTLAQVQGQPSFDHAWSDDALLRGLARHGQRPHQPTPAKAADWLTDPGEGQHLLWLDSCALPTQADDGPGWQAALEQLEADWFAPLLAALDAGQLERLTLSTSGAYGSLSWHIPPASRWQRLVGKWAKPQPPSLADLAQRLRH